jgi:excisionase family DNA binding protein
MADRQWLTVEETAHTLSVSKATVYKALRMGEISGLKIGRQWRVFLPDLEGKAKEGLP